MPHSRLLLRGRLEDDLGITHPEEVTVPVGAEVEADLAVEKVTARVGALQEDEVHLDQAVHLQKALGEDKKQT